MSAVCLLSVLSDDIKHAKQLFVSGLTGTTVTEVALLGCVLPVRLQGHIPHMRRTLSLLCAPQSSAHWLTVPACRVCVSVCACQLCFALRYSVSRLLSWPTTSSASPSASATLLDVAVWSGCVLIPATLSLTAASSQLSTLLAALLLATVAVAVLAGCSVSLRGTARDSAASSSSVSSTLFVSLYRCGLLLSTAIAILGVDFEVFPRRLAKTEQFGVSPMDAGVGGFMFAAALTSPAVRPHTAARASLTGTVKRQLPVVLLGCLRLLAVKWTNYQEHVTEYGVHWNFFFTLAAGQTTATAQQLVRLSTAAPRLRRWRDVPLTVVVGPHVSFRCRMSAQ